MIAYLEGKLQFKRLDGVVVNAGGVGYLVHVSSQTLAELPGEGERVALLCHTHVREDALQVFGFLRPEELRAFELLILVSGIGPRLALTMLSGLPVSDLVRAVSGGDLRRLQSIPGVGKKTAERVVLELRERFARDFAPGAEAAPLQVPGLRSQEVVDALVNLGYKRPMAEKAVAAVVKAGGTVEPERILRQALQAMTEMSRG